MKLVITEKPSVAQTLAVVLGAKKRNNGYLEGNGYKISWCYGHLFEMAEPGAYDERYVKWRRVDLPILPEKWLYTPSKDKREQIAVLRRLMADKDIDGVMLKLLKDCGELLGFKIICIVPHI